MEYIIVQAGGRGARLKYLTQNKPKALAPVDNLPMLFHLFRKYPGKRFIIIADYRKEVLYEYLSAFAEVKYMVVEAEGKGTCGGVAQALRLIPEKQPFMLVWSDLVLPEGFRLPAEYEGEGKAEKDYVGISSTFPCRWSYSNGRFEEKKSTEHGVAGFFLFSDKGKLDALPQSGELVRWMGQRQLRFEELSLAGTREFGLLEQYQKLEPPKCRPFNRVKVENGVFTKTPVDSQGEALAKREWAWYEKAARNHVRGIPEVYGNNPLRMEYIRGKNIYECGLPYREKEKLLVNLVGLLCDLHKSQRVPADVFSLREAYYRKTMARLSKVQDLIPFGREREITVNGKRCRNIYYHKRELEKRIGMLSCQEFCFIHGDCTFSNMMLREDGTPVLIDPRGYFGYTELYGDERYDWAKLYYSIAGNYDRFNLKDFRLGIGGTPEEGVKLEIGSNHWEDMEDIFWELTGADAQEIKLIHAVIWLSLTTYAWQDYDSICGAFYNGLYYLEDVL